MKDLIWYQRSDQRLSAWREFRLKLDQLSLDAALQEVCTLWSFAPYVTYYLDPAKPQEWPDPWQLLSENYYCDLAKTLGIFYTIALSKHGANDVKLQIYNDTHRKEQINIVVVNDKLVINYHFNRIVNTDAISQDCVLQRAYDATDLRIKNYQ